MKKVLLLFVLICCIVTNSLFAFPGVSSSQNQFDNESFLIHTSNTSFQHIQPSIKIAMKEGRISNWKWFPKNSIIEISGDAATIKNMFQSIPSQMIPNFTVQSDPIIKHSTLESLPPKNWNLEDLQIQSIWEQGYTGKGVKICILDTGCDGSHPQLKGKIKDFAVVDRNGEAILSDTSYDTDTHGTHVAGIAAGGSQNSPLGMAPESDLSVGVVIPGGSGSFSQIIGGIEWAMDPDGNPETNDAPIAINLSLGMPGFVDFWTPVFVNALNHNILIVSSSGNEGNGITNSPGNHPLVVGVGSYGFNRKPSSFSAGDSNIQWNSSTIATAPYIKPDISAPGSMVYSCVPGNSYEYYSGTSMSAPHITGAVAILKQAFPKATAWDLRNFLLWGGDDLGKQGWDTRYGQGALNIEKSLHAARNAALIHGTIQHYSDEYSLWIQELQSGIYINADGHFSCHLIPGKYTIQLRTGRDIVQTQSISVTGQKEILGFSLPNPAQMTLEGIVLDPNGKAISEAKIVYGNAVFHSDEKGHFTVPLQQGDDIIIRKSGYIEERIQAKMETSWLNIRLEKTPLLLVEGKSPYSTTINPPQQALPIYMNTLQSIGQSYALIRCTEETLSYEDLKGFSKVLLFYASGGMQSNEMQACSTYLDNGGNLIISGRMVMLLEQFYRTNFLLQYAGIYSKKMIAFPSVEGIHPSYEDILFHLSGSGGANNQEICDVLIKDVNANCIPFLKYSSIADKEYAAVMSNTSEYKLAFLGFGLEGIGLESSRRELLQRLLDWTDQGGKIKMNLPPGKTYITMRRNHEILEKVTEETSVSFQNLFMDTYTFELERYGKKKILFECDFTKGNSYIANAYFSDSGLQRVEIRPQNCSASEAYFMVYYKDTLLYTKKYDPSTTIIEDLPQGDYLFCLSAKGYKNQYYKLSIQACESEPRIALMEMQKLTIPVLVVDDSPTGWSLLDHYLRIGEYTTRWIETSGIAFQHWSVEEKGFPAFHDVYPYEIVIHIAGRNPYALYTPDRQKTIGEYLDTRGNYVILSNSAHTVLDESEWFANYFGIQTKHVNIREKTLVGLQNTPTESMYFDLYNSLEQDGLYITFPEFEPTNPNTKPLFQYASQKLCSSYFDNGVYRAIYLPFGLDNITNTDVRIKVVQLAKKLLETGEYSQ
ncbi:MAG: S8 family serine peptidase [Caldisericia bacterium]|nr:S8 family serine peptidase [Caldisericia bacterium]